MKILNLYAGIGGNRYNWDGHDVTAVELDKEIAEVYRSQFPTDALIITDAHAFLLANFREFDFIWTSPPCKTHSKLNIAALGQGREPRYADMTLYEEIILLQSHAIKKPVWVVENTTAYFQPLIKPTQRLGRHLIWSNIYFNVSLPAGSGRLIFRSPNQLKRYLGLSHLMKEREMNSMKWRQMLRNCFHPKIAEQMLDDVLRKMQRCFKPFIP